MRRSRERGFTLVELIVATTIMTLLTTMAVPLARYKVRRDKERDLVYALRTIHKAIDDYKDAALAGKIETKLGTDGYPETLEDLVEGVNLVQSADEQEDQVPAQDSDRSDDRHKRIGASTARRTTRPAPAWGGQNVFSVYTKSLERDADGILYSQVAERSAAQRLHADRADHRDGDHLHPGLDRGAVVPEIDRPHQGEPAQEQSLHVAHGDRRVHLRQEEGSANAPGSGQRRLSARGAHRSDDRQRHDLGDGSWKTRSQWWIRPSPEFSTCAAART